MSIICTANELNTCSGEAAGSVEAEERLIVDAADTQAELEDDDVEAVIIRMDRTSAELLFLHAQRHL